MIVGDLEAVNEQIAEYGKLEKEKVNEIVRTQDAIERKIENEKKLADEPVKEEKVEAEAAANNDEEGDEERKYVICPKCGEKIWVL